MFIIIFMAVFTYKRESLRLGMHLLPHSARVKNENSLYRLQSMACWNSRAFQQPLVILHAFSS